MHIPVYQPFLNDEERKAVIETLNSGWISSKGKNISEFEKIVSGYIGMDYALSVSNGTTAIHVALDALGATKKMTRIVIPDMTYVASLTPAIHLSCDIELTDVDSETWLADLCNVEPKANFELEIIETVDLFGSPFDIDSLADLKSSGFRILSDSAESFGSFIGEAHAGALSDAMTLSFFGNKTITTGEGGMVCTNDQALAKEVSRLKNQGLSEDIEYFHDIPGYNFRMTNLQAAIGIAQFQKIYDILSLKKKIYDYYDSNLDAYKFTRQKFSPNSKPSHWVCSFLAPSESEKNKIRNNLEASGVESRPFFTPLHLMPFVPPQQKKFPVSEDLWRRGFSLPSWPGLSEKELEKVVHIVNSSLS